MPSKAQRQTAFKFPTGLTTSTSIFETVTSTTRILHLLYHRNKNQHRRSVWWRHFSILRREIRRVHADLEALYAINSGGTKSTTTVEPPNPRSQHGRRRQQQRQLRQSSSTGIKVQSKPLQPKSKRVRLAELEELVRQRLEFWLRANLVERWYRAFSQLVADPQYAPLGLVLLAILARSCSVLGITGAMQNLTDANEEAIRQAIGRLESDVKTPMATVEDHDVDEGVPVQRRDESNVKETKPNVREISKLTKRSTRKEKAPNKKPTSNLDAIDAIFGGL